MHGLSTNRWREPQQWAGARVYFWIAGAAAAMVGLAYLAVAVVR